MSSLNLGDRVKVSAGCRYADDWRGWEGYVTGLRVIARTGAIDVLVSEHWPPLENGDYTDGFDPSELEVVVNGQTKEGS